MRKDAIDRENNISKEEIQNPALSFIQGMENSIMQTLYLNSLNCLWEDLHFSNN